MNGAGHLVLQVLWGHKFLSEEASLPTSDFIDQSNLAIFRLRTCLQEDKDRLTVSRFQDFFVSGRNPTRLGHTVARPQDQDHKIGLSHSAKGFYPEITDGCKRAENFWSCLATLRRILGLWNRSMYSNTSALAASSVG